jgi:uncharacterized protein (TIGR00251 family)
VRLDDVEVTEVPEGTIFTVFVHPRSARTRLQLSSEGVHAFLQSPPSKGKANRELVKLLRRELGFPAEILGGFKSPAKEVLIRNVKPEALGTAFQKIQQEE